MSDVDPARPVVAVVGAGISGLAAAWRLCDGPTAPRVLVLDRAASPGGALRLGEVGDVRIDLGAESMLARRPEGLDLAREVGLADDLVHPRTASASVASRGRLHRLPTGTVMGVPGDAADLTGLLTPDEVARVADEPGRVHRRVDGDVGVREWVAGRVGPAVVDRLVEPLLGGVYAGHATRLSLRATVPALWPCARDGGSVLAAVREVAAGAPATPVFAGIRGGVGRLAQALVAALAARGVPVRTAVTVRSLERSVTGWRLVCGPVPRPEVIEVDAVVVAVPPSAAARLLARECSAAARELAAVETASVAVVAALVPRADLAGLDGSGVLVPPVEGRAVKAATFASAKWAWLDGQDADHVVVRASLGRAGEAAVLQRDDGDLARLALRDLADLLGRPLRPRASTVVRWGGALPQYAVGHVQRVERARRAVARVPGLAVCGAALDGVGIPACIAAASAAASRIRAATAAAPERPPAGPRGTMTG